MNRTFWQGFLVGALAFGTLGLWAAPRPRPRSDWQQRRRAVMRGARRLLKVSRGAARGLARQVRR